MTKEQELRLSDRELEVIKRYADEHGMSIDEAATALMHAAMEKKFRKNLNRGPAKVYTLRRKS